MHFWEKNKNITKAHKKYQTLKALLKPGIESGNTRTQSGRVTSSPPSQQRLWIVVTLVICFDAMG